MTPIERAFYVIDTVANEIEAEFGMKARGEFLACVCAIAISSLQIHIQMLPHAATPEIFARFKRVYTARFPEYELPPPKPKNRPTKRRA